MRDCDTLNGLPPLHVGVTGLTRQDIFDKVEKARSCCDIVEIKEFIPENGGESQHKISNGNYCNTPAICPICATTKQARQRRGLADGIKAACEKYPYVYMLTFTVAPDDNLNRQMNHIKKSFRRWCKFGQKRYPKNRPHYYDRGEYGKARAGFLSWEIKRGENSKKWHVHAHALVWTADRLDYSYLDQDKKKHLMRLYRTDNFFSLSERIQSEAVKPDCWVNLDGKNMPAAKINREWHAATGNSVHLDARPVGFNTGGKMAYMVKDKLKSRQAGKPVYRKKFVSSPGDYFSGIFKNSFEILTYYSKLLENPADDAISIMDNTHCFKFFSSLRDMRKSKTPQEERDAAGIFSIRYEDGEYSPPRRERAEIIRNLNDIMKKGFLERAAQIQGEYRRRRNTILKENRGVRNLAILLDDTRQAFRTRMKVLWSQYTRARLSWDIDEKEIETAARDRERHLSEIGVQVSFSF